MKRKSLILAALIALGLGTAFIAAALSVDPISAAQTN
jgi:hypothetical protein